MIVHQGLRIISTTSARKLTRIDLITRGSDVPCPMHNIVAGSLVLEYTTC